MAGRLRPRVARGRVPAFAILALVSQQASATAQATSPVFIIGAHAAVVRSGEFDASDSGVGARVAWHPTGSVGIEAEVTVYTGDFPKRRAFSRGRTEGLLGVTVGPRLGQFRPYGAVRAGFLTFRAASEPLVCILIYPPPIDCTLAAGRTVPAVDVGGGLDVFPIGHLVLRIDAADRVLKHPLPASYSHDFRISGGVGLGF